MIFRLLVPVKVHQAGDPRPGRPRELSPAGLSPCTLPSRTPAFRAPHTYLLGTPAPPPAGPAPSARWPPPPPPSPGPVPSSPAHQVTPARPALRRRPAVSTCRPLDQPLEGILGLAPPQSLLPGRTPEKAKEEEGTAPPYPSSSRPAPGSRMRLADGVGVVDRLWDPRTRELTVVK